MGPLNSGNPFFGGSQVYDPVALFRRDSEILVIARVGMSASKRFMILTPAGRPAWPHEPIGSLSDVAWALVAHDWHEVAPEPVGSSSAAARTLARLLAERA